MKGSRSLGSTSMLFVGVGNSQRWPAEPGAVSGPDPHDTLTDWDRLTPTARPNGWLLAPRHESFPRIHQVAPEFEVSPSALAESWLAVIEDQPRTKVIARSADGLLIEAAQRSRAFGCVDRISARIIALGSSRSALAVYSRSTVGYWDIGVNRRRVQAWILALADRTAWRDERFPS